jgi:hypothetical protein
VRTPVVVVLYVFAENSFELTAAKDKPPVPALLAQGANAALGLRVRLWRSDRGAYYLDPLAAEDLVEGGGELRLAIAEPVVPVRP